MASALSLSVGVICHMKLSSPPGITSPCSSSIPSSVVLPKVLVRLAVVSPKSAGSIPFSVACIWFPLIGCCPLFSTSTTISWFSSPPVNSVSPEKLIFNPSLIDVAALAVDNPPHAVNNSEARIIVGMKYLFIYTNIKFNLFKGCYLFSLFQYS